VLDKPKKTKRARAVRVVAFGGQREQGIVCKVRTPLPPPHLAAVNGGGSPHGGRRFPFINGSAPFSLSDL